MSMAAAAVSRETISTAARPIAFDVNLGRKAVKLGLSLIGQMLVRFGNAVQRRLNERLERDAYALRGLTAAVRELRPIMTLDDDHQLKNLLQTLEEQVLDYQVFARQALEERALVRMRFEFSRAVQLSSNMQEAIIELEDAIIAHDQRVRAGDDSPEATRVRRELGRRDDVPPGRYQEMATMIARLPQSGEEPRAAGRIPR